MEQTKKTPSEQALGIAARCWTDPMTSDRVMDTELATIFAEKIDEQLDLMMTAWGIIANAYGGDWDRASTASGWKDAAIRWRDDMHKFLEENFVDVSSHVENPVDAG